MEQFELIRQWAEQRGLYEKGDAKTQFVKLQEESGELAQAILKKDKELFIDSIGDLVVVLTNIAELGNQYFECRDITIEKCLLSAWQEIKDRKGKMDNGTFKKN